jgi:hypothetical protein
LEYIAGGKIASMDALQKGVIMKVKNCLVVLAGSAIVLTSPGRSFAQTQLTRDGYAVTPKMLQMAESGGTPLPAAGGGEVIVGESPNPNVVVAPSAHEQTAVFPSTYYESQPVGYKTTWNDGIAASPRARQMMMENKYPMPAMGGSQYIGDESMRGKVTVTPQGQRVWVESHPGTGVTTGPGTSAPYYQPRGVGYEVTSEYGIAAPPRAWKQMCESAGNPEMITLR